MVRVVTRQNVMLLLAFLSIVLIVFVVVYFKVDGNTAVGGALLTLIGSFAGDIKTAFNWEFGSSRGSSDKTELLAQAPPIGSKVARAPSSREGGG